MTRRGFEINWSYVFSVLFIFWLVAVTGMMYLLSQAELFSQDLVNKSAAQQLLY